MNMILFLLSRSSQTRGQRETSMQLTRITRQLVRSAFIKILNIIGEQFQLGM